MTAGATTNVGARLQQARIQAGISLREVSARTKIREVLLVAIERGDFERLPADLLARGFIRAYAREVGLDPEMVVRQFVDEFQTVSPVPASRLLPPADSVDVDQRRPHRHGRWSLLYAVILVMGVAALVAYFSDFSTVRYRSVSGAADTAESVEDARATDSGFESVGLEIYTELDPDIAAPVDAVFPLTIEINPTRVVWVQAVADGERVLYELIDSDQPRLIKARQEIVFRIGDAEAFQYSVNTVRGRPIGGPGEVRDIRISRDNYTTFQDR